jgi:hypothetical protein
MAYLWLNVETTYLWLNVKTAYLWLNAKMAYLRLNVKTFKITYQQSPLPSHTMQLLALCKADL